jgi:hypothetical protein
VVFPVLSVVFFQSKSEEQALTQVKLDLQTLWLAAKIALASIAAVSAASVILFFFTRWHRIRVFITFHHSLEERIRIMRDKLHAQGLYCDFIPFDPQALHDNILSRVTTNIRSADLVIAVPGNEPSFIDSEILSATALRKPLLIVSEDVIGRTLHTAYEGYPRFSLKLLEESGYKPLAQFIEYVCNHWSCVLNAIGSAMGGFFVVWSGSVGVLIVGHFFLGLLSSLVSIFSLEMSFKIKRIETYAIMAIVAVAAVVAIIAFGVSVIEQIKTRRISRQTTLTGKSTYQMLKDTIKSSFIDQKLVKCLLKPIEAEDGRLKNKT